MAAQAPRAPPLPGAVAKAPASPPATEGAYFTVLEEGAAIEVLEGSGNTFHLGPILRKYTSARLVVKGARRSTVVELSLLYDALGLLRSLQYDVEQFNSAAGDHALSSSELRYRCYRLTRQASAFGVRVPRPGTSTVAVPGLTELVSYIESVYADALISARGLVAGGVVDFAGLAELFTPGRDMLDRGAATGLFGVPTAMRVRAAYYSRGKNLFGIVSTFYAGLEFVVSVGDRFAVVEAAFPIGEFQGTRSTSEGLHNFVTLTDAMRQELTSRGQLYEATSSSCAYLQYEPGAFLPVPRAGAGGVARAAARARGGGRVMVDAAAAWARGVHCARSEGTASDAVKGVLKLVAQRGRSAAAATATTSAGASGSGSGQDQYTAGSGGQSASAEEESLDLLLLSSPLPSSLRWLTWPVLPGFSFSCKSWGVCLASALRPVQFNTAAFARLVLPPERKRLIEALVLSHHASTASASASGTAAVTRTDVIAGKGEGSIFLLYGPPGVGKTLTAEAIAELLHKPLYVVSMGELGTSPEALEERLQDILDLCVPWGALVLIDEAEMLLERRSKNDIVRNAMVCVMLRLLEYYSGILFLTTNRVESLDPAFQSRVQCALRYAPLDAAARAAIWTDLLSHSGAEGAEGIDVAALAAHELNGRQIKNVLQLALALCRHEGVPLGPRHLEATLGITTAFIKEHEEE